MKFIFSLIPVYGILSLVGVIGLGLGMFDLTGLDTRGGAYVVVAFIAMCVIGFVSIISTFISVFTHVEELGKLQTAKEQEQAAELHRTAVKEHTEMITNIATDLDDSILAKSNVDHPIVKAMQSLTSAEKDLQDSRNAVARLGGNIAARKRGPFGWVVSMYGEE